uniref:Uncharacterized protein n=1 Tax=Arundo donax TaxID=35708 RepID=A0A0A9DV40_ARUDO
MQMQRYCICLAFEGGVRSIEYFTYMLVGFFFYFLYPLYIAPMGLGLLFNTTTIYNMYYFAHSSLEMFPKQCTIMLHIQTQS